MELNKNISNEPDNTCEELNENDIATQQNNLEDMYKIKKAKVVLWKLSKQEIDDLTIHKNIKIRPKRSRPPQCSVNKNSHPQYWERITVEKT